MVIVDYTRIGSNKGFFYLVSEKIVLTNPKYVYIRVPSCRALGGNDEMVSAAQQHKMFLQGTADERRLISRPCEASVD